MTESSALIPVECSERVQFVFPLVPLFDILARFRSFKLDDFLLDRSQLTEEECGRGRGGGRGEE